jgi:hypothetical protein
MRRIVFAFDKRNFRFNKNARTNGKPKLRSDKQQLLIRLYAAQATLFQRLKLKHAATSHKAITP